MRSLSRRLFCIVNISGTRRRGQGDKVHTGRGEERRDMTRIVTLIIPGYVVRPSPLHATPPVPPPPSREGVRWVYPPLFLFWWETQNSRSEEREEKTDGPWTDDITIFASTNKMKLVGFYTPAIRLQLQNKRIADYCNVTACCTSRPMRWHHDNWQFICSVPLISMGKCMRTSISIDKKINNQK